MTVYLNGQFLEDNQALVSIDDRGFLFADGVYEVVHLYRGRPFEWDRHLARLKRSLAAVHIVGVSEDLLVDVRDRLIRENPAPESALYIQVTRGVQKRNHAPPAPGAVSPTLLMWVRPVEPISQDVIGRGVPVITAPDDRWAKVWIKTIGLLPNILAKRQALEEGVFDAVFVRDGMVMEATSANIFRVSGGVIQTAPVTNYILPGITRDVVIELARNAGYVVSELPFTIDELYHADEVFLTGTTTEVLPVTEVDGRPISSGAGPVALQLLELLRAKTAAL